MDPDWALYHTQRALWDPVKPSRLGSLDPVLQYRVNGEVYRFSSERTLQRFMKSPTRWCGTVRDPVNGCRFKPSARSPEAHWIGGPYYFESDSTKARFVEDPQAYAIIRRM